MEQLETLGVPVIGYGCDRLPAFYTADSDIDIPSVDGLEQLLAAIEAHAALDLPGGIVVAAPPPPDHALPRAEVDHLVDQAQARLPKHTESMAQPRPHSC